MQKDYYQTQQKYPVSFFFGQKSIYPVSYTPKFIEIKYLLKQKKEKEKNEIPEEMPKKQSQWWRNGLSRCR